MKLPSPYIPPQKSPPELSLRAALLGLASALLFGAGNMYLGLKVGMTVTAAIPAVIVALAFIKQVFREGSALEATVVQSIASSGDALMNGVIFTVPALIFLFPQTDVVTLFLYTGVGAAIGGLLGILFMIPLRHLLVVEEHFTLPFPEGKACANIIIAGDKGGETATPVVWGVGTSALAQLLFQGFKLWNNEPFWTFNFLKKASFGFEASPVMMGVGYIIGLDIALVMLAGGVLAWMVLIPLMELAAGTAIGDFFSIAPSLSGLDAFQIWERYIRYIGAGAVAAGGIISAVKVVPMVVKTVKPMLKSFRSQAEQEKLRTAKDLPMPLVLAGALVLLLLLWLIPTFRLNAGAVVVTGVFALLFVAVSARMVGLIGTTSQPVSGMTIAALMLASLFLILMGYRGETGKIAALSLGVVVAVSICTSGNISQDLKTGFYVGNTPAKLQMAEMLGSTFAALFAGLILMALHKAYVIGSARFPAPQGKLLETLINGIMGGTLPWRLLLLGAALAVIAELLGLSSLSFAIGLYLPITTSASLIFGALVNHFVRRKTGKSFEKADKSATLFASGLIAGGAITAVLLAVLKIAGFADKIVLRYTFNPWFDYPVAIAVFVLFGWLVYRWAMKGLEAR